MLFYQLYANNTDVNGVKTQGTRRFLFGKEGGIVKLHLLFLKLIPLHFLLSTTNKNVIYITKDILILGNLFTLKTLKGVKETQLDCFSAFTFSSFTMTFFTLFHHVNEPFTVFHTSTMVSEANSVTLSLRTNKNHRMILQLTLGYLGQKCVLLFGL